MKSLQDPVATLKGVGPKRAADLATLGIDTVEDLLTYYPNRYDDVTPADLENVQDRQRITTQGTVVSEPLLSHFGYRRSRLSFRLQVGPRVIMVTFFNQAYLAKRVALGQTVTVMGKWDAQRAQVTANKFLSAGDQEQADSGAVYSVNKHIRQATLRG